MLLLALVLQACAVNRDSASVAPDADLARVKTLYVVRAAQDEQGVYIAIAQQLRQMGRTVSTGPATTVPPGTEAVLSYQAQWQWDMAMYLLELRVFLRDPKSDALLASATSYHTSAARKSTEEMVTEVLNNVFSGTRPAAAGAGGGLLGNVTVRLAPYKAATGTGRSAATAAVRLEPVLDGRRDAVGALIGERTTVGNMSMGMIELAPPATQAVGDMLRAELGAAGYRTDEADAPVRIVAQMKKFQVATPATMLYWDLNGEIELGLVATGSAGRRHETRYTAQCTDRTFDYPSEDLIRGVVQACLKTIGAKLRNDAALAALLDAR